MPRSLAIPILVLALALCPSLALSSQDAYPSPGQGDVFILWGDYDPSQSSPLLDALVESCTAHYDWLDFKLGQDRAIRLDADRALSASTLSRSIVDKGLGLLAYSRDLGSIHASGGRVYAVKVKAASLRGAKGPALQQPSLYALLKAARLSKQSRGQARVVSASYARGVFTYKVAVR